MTGIRNGKFSGGEVKAFVALLFALCAVALPSSAEQERVMLIPEHPPAGWSSERYFTLAQSYKSMGLPEKAKEALSLAIKVDKGGVIKKRAETMMRAELPRYTVSPEANHLNNLGFEKLAHKEYAAAITLLNKCTVKYPRFEWPFASLSTIYLMQKKPALARFNAQKTLAINPFSSNGWLNLGNAALLDGDYRSARKHALKAIECNPDNANASEMLRYIDNKFRTR
jgi:tetratricopeptide (TPR) repeat protein